jgi:hypothetical protein
MSQTRNPRRQDCFSRLCLRCRCRHPALGIAGRRAYGIAHIPQFRQAHFLGFVTDAWPNRFTAGKSCDCTDLAVFCRESAQMLSFACGPRGQQSDLARRRTSQSLAVPGFIGIRSQYSENAPAQTAECGVAHRRLRIVQLSCRFGHRPVSGHRGQDLKMDQVEHRSKISM